MWMASFGVPLDALTVGGSDDPGGVAPVVRTAVDGQGHVDGVAGLEPHTVGPGWIIGA